MTRSAGRCPRPDKVVVRVLAALREGYDNSHDIGLIVSIPASHVAVYLGELREAGLAKITHRNWGHWNEARRGRKFHRWAAV